MLLVLYGGLSCVIIIVVVVFNFSIETIKVEVERIEWKQTDERTNERTAHCCLLEFTILDVCACFITQTEIFSFLFYC